jgi:hypothetical protein
MFNINGFLFYIYTSTMIWYTPSIVKKHLTPFKRMPTLRQVQTKVDDWLTNNWSSLVARQQNFYANRNNYWQATSTHSTPPSFASNRQGDAPPDQLDTNPTDEFENWRTAFPQWDGVDIPCSLQIDIYQGDAGKGWVLHITFKYDEVIYRKSVNVGPEPSRERDWRIIGDL